jgi:hypothetical protein
MHRLVKASAATCGLTVSLVGLLGASPASALITCVPPIPPPILSDWPEPWIPSDDFPKGPPEFIGPPENDAPPAPPIAAPPAQPAPPVCDEVGPPIDPPVRRRRGVRCDDGGPAFGSARRVAFGGNPLPV